MLEHALRLLFLYAEKEPIKYVRAALRRLARYATGQSLSLLRAARTGVWSGRLSSERMDETIFFVRPARNKQKLAQSLPADSRLEALDRRRRVQPLKPAKVCE